MKIKLIKNTIYIMLILTLSTNIWSENISRLTCPIYQRNAEIPGFVNVGFAFQNTNSDKNSKDEIEYQNRLNIAKKVIKDRELWQQGQGDPAIVQSYHEDTSTNP